jgi:hypothetical protein
MHGKPGGAFELAIDGLPALQLGDDIGNDVGRRRWGGQATKEALRQIGNDFRFVPERSRKLHICAGRSLGPRELCLQPCTESTVWQALSGRKQRLTYPDDGCGRTLALAADFLGMLSQASSIVIVKLVVIERLLPA